MKQEKNVKPLRIKKNGEPAKRTGPAPGTPKVKRNLVAEANHRSNIQTSKLLNKLQNHVLKKTTLTATQLQAAKILLAKTIPDLKNIEHAGNVGLTVSKITEEIIKPDGN